MLIIAVTGGIGSGKSTVAGLFHKHDVPVIDTDEIARELVQPGQPALQEIIDRFGETYRNRDGSLNRRALREAVFASDAARAKLEAILHPRIHATVLEQISQLDADYCLIIIPLLARSTHQYPHDRILVVDADEATRLQRTSTRDAQDEQVTRQMIAAQADRATLLAMADDVIDNNGDLSVLNEQINRLHDKYTVLAQRKAGKH